MRDALSWVFHGLYGIWTCSSRSCLPDWRLDGFSGAPSVAVAHTASAAPAYDTYNPCSVVTVSEFVGILSWDLVVYRQRVEK